MRYGLPAWWRRWGSPGPCQGSLPPWTATAGAPWVALAKDPLLVGSAVAGPQDHFSTVGGSGPEHVQAQSGQRAGDGAVCVQVPLLFGPAVAGPDDHRRAVGGAVLLGVQAS